MQHTPFCYTYGQLKRLINRVHKKNEVGRAESLALLKNFKEGDSLKFALIIGGKAMLRYDQMALSILMDNDPLIKEHQEKSEFTYFVP